MKIIKNVMVFKKHHYWRVKSKIITDVNENAEMTLNVMLTLVNLHQKISFYVNWRQFRHDFPDTNFKYVVWFHFKRVFTGVLIFLVLSVFEFCFFYWVNIHFSTNITQKHSSLVENDFFSRLKQKKINQNLFSHVWMKNV